MRITRLFLLKIKRSTLLNQNPLANQNYLRARPRVAFSRPGCSGKLRIATAGPRQKNGSYKINTPIFLPAVKASRASQYWQQFCFFWRNFFQNCDKKNKLIAA